MTSHKLILVQLCVATLVGACAGAVDPKASDTEPTESVSVSEPLSVLQLTQIDQDNYELTSSLETRQALGIARWTVQRIEPTVLVAAHDASGKAISSFDFDPAMFTPGHESTATPKSPTRDAYFADLKSYVELTASDDDLVSKGGDPTCGACDGCCGLTKHQCTVFVQWCTNRNFCGLCGNTYACGACIGWSFDL